MAEQLKANNMKDFVARIQKAQKKLDDECEGARNAIFSKVEFNCVVQCIPGDGVVVLNEDTDQVAPFNKCLQVINEKGTLSEEDHDEISI